MIRRITAWVKGIWHDEDRRIKWIVGLLIGAVLVMVASVLGVVLVMDQRVRDLTLQQAATDQNITESISGAINEAFQTFQDSNPTVPVPQVIVPSPSPSETPTKKVRPRQRQEPAIYVLPAKETPAPSLPPPSVTPRVIIREKEKVRYRKRRAPTPKPWYNFFKSTR